MSIEVSIHNPKPGNADMLGGLKTVVFRITTEEERSRVLLFFSREELRTMILALTEAEFLFGTPNDSERLTFTRQ